MKKEGIKDQPPEQKGFSLKSFFRLSSSKTSSQASFHSGKEDSNSVKTEEDYENQSGPGRTPSEEELHRQQQEEAYYEGQAAGYSADNQLRGPPLPPTAPKPYFNPGLVQGRGRRPSPPRKPLLQYSDMNPFIDLLTTANGIIPSDLIPGASVDAAFRKNLMKVINIDFKELLLASQNVIQSAQTLFEYKGMDIWIILQKYIQKASQDPDAQKNLILMVVLLCERGTNFDKYSSKMSKDGANMVNYLKNKYNLVSKLNKSKSNELTLARVGHCFHLLVCSYMEQCLSPTVSDMAMNKWTEGYPKCMKTSAFTALIPRADISGFKDVHKQTLTIAYLCHQIEFSKVVTKKKEHKATIEEWIDLTYPYAVAGIEAEYLDDTQRINSLVTLGLWDIRATDFTSTAISKAANALSKYMRSSD